MDEKSNHETNGYGIYRMLDAVKSKLPERYKDCIYNGIYIGLKSDYIRYIMDPSRNNRIQFFMIFVKDCVNRSQKYKGNKYVKSNKSLWFYLCSGFNKFELSDLTPKIRKELFNYISDHKISAINHYNEKMLREEIIFFFDDTNELHGNNKYEKYIDDLKNKYTNNAVCI